MSEWFALLVPALGAALLHFLWQGALLGLCTALALALLGNARPQARYAVACIALCGMALLPVITLAWLLSPSANGDAGGMVTLADAGRAPVAPGAAMPSAGYAPGLQWVVMLWASGALALLLRMVGGLWWVRRLRLRAWTDGAEIWQARADALSQRFGLARVQVRLFDGDAPLALGWWKPVVLLPAALAMRMPTALLEALLAHELAHIRRHDYLVNLLQGVVESLLFHHPVVWWLSRRMRHERELIADELAAAAIGDRRSLALALSELDRMLGATAAAPIPPFAHAAHGGHLMSRIQHLLRPRRHPLATALALPLLGLALAGAGLYAHATDGARHAAPATPVSPPPAPPAPPALPAPVAAPTPAALPALPALAAPPAPPAPPARVDASIAAIDSDDGYALVRGGQTQMKMRGTGDDIDAIRRLRREIGGDFLWLRRDGKAYVVRDAGVLASVNAAWRQVDALDARMQAMQSRMQPHQQKLDELQARMDRIAPTESPEMEAASQQMQALAERQQELAGKQSRLAAKMVHADDATRDVLQRDIDQLSGQIDALSAQMDAHARVMDRQAQAMQLQSAKMEAVSRDMQAAAAPMEAIGKDMEALGGQIEREAEIADQRIRSLIDQAVARGLAQPVSRS